MLSGIELVVFDFDGVILESAQIKTDAFREMFGDDARAVGYHLAHQGISRFEKFRFYREQVLGLAFDDAVSVQMNADFDAIVQHRILAAPFVAGAVELLDGLRGRIPLYIASGTPEVELRRIVAARELEDYFDGVFGSPASKGVIAAQALSRHAVSCEQGLFIGDATADLDGAIAAGMLFVGRVAVGHPNPFSTVSALTVRDLAELADAWDGSCSVAMLERSRR